MNQEAIHLYRSDLTLAIAKVDGVLNGLVLAAQTGQAISPSTLELARETWKGSRERLNVSGLDHWPDIDENVTIGDLIVMFSAIRSVHYCFLSPEQFAELQSPPDFGLSGIARRKAAERR